MFEAAEIGNSVTPRRYDAELPRLRAKLLEAHLALRAQKFQVVVIVSGADSAGKGELVHRLNEWLDPRGVVTLAFGDRTDEERERPEYWRFWRALPGRGRIGIFFGSWYSRPIVERVYKQSKPGDFDAALDRIAEFERMLADDGTLFVKLWLHLTRKEQKRRLKKLADIGRLTPLDRKHYKLYDRFISVTERALRRTDLPHAPWHVIEATDRRFRELTAGRLLLEALNQRLKAVAKAAPAPAAPATRKPAAKRPGSILDHVDLTRKLAKADYERQLSKYQEKLSRLTWEAKRKGVPVVMVFEGWDAAGKGSAIRRVTQAVDPRLYRVVGIAAPTDEERAQHYLWRFWRHLPRAGCMTIFDRSWYGRVLVERVEGFATPEAWGRSFSEINAFEEQMAAHGTVLCKFWLHISQEEQLRRFKERQVVQYKQHKITDEDWRNRDKWPAYLLAADDMISHCSTEFAPWTLVAGNDKRFARVQILKTLVDRLEQAL